MDTNADALRWNGIEASEVEVFEPANDQEIIIGWHIE